MPWQVKLRDSFLRHQSAIADIDGSCEAEVAFVLDKLSRKTDPFFFARSDPETAAYIAACIVRHKGFRSREERYTSPFSPKVEEYIRKHVRQGSQVGFICCNVRGWLGYNLCWSYDASDRIIWVGILDPLLASGKFTKLLFEG